jgi:6-phosphogluconolactonase
MLETEMKIEIFADAETVAREAAKIIAGEARAAVAARGKFLFAVSGGKTPWQMLRVLAAENLPWIGVHIFQVDERVAPAGHADRNLTHLRESLKGAPLPAEQIHAMLVEETNLDAAAENYAATLARFAGAPPVLDLVHLGLGADGHTASLVPNDAAMDVTGRDVALTGIYQQRRRMTLTYPLLNRARKILWVATGAEKVEMLRRLQAGDATIPAGRIVSANAVVLADSAAAGK